MKSILKFSFPIFGCILLPVLLHIYPPKIIAELDKRLYFSSFVLVVLILFFYKNFENSNENIEKRLIELTNKLPDIVYYFIFLIFTLITQNYLLNYETLSWDIPTYLVATYDIAEGNLPYTTQWETKGPLLVYIYYFLSILSGKTYIIFRILNDLILFLISVIVFKLVMVVSKNEKITAFSSSFLFLTIFGMRWYISEFSELYCLVFLSLSSLVLLRTTEIELNKLFIVSFLISLSALINQVAIIFIFPVFIFLYFEKRLNTKVLFYLFIGGAVPQAFFALLYMINNQFDIYFFNYFILPFTYVGGTGVEKNLIYEFTVWLRELFNYQNFLYFSIFSTVCFNLFQIFKYKISRISNLNMFLYVNTLFAFTIYFLGGWGFAHHLFYFVFFFSLLVACINNKKSKVLIYSFVVISGLSVFFQTYETSTYNLRNFESLQENYPLYKLSNEIDSYYDDYENYEIFALEYVLVLYYLEKPNFSYIIHPTNHFQEYITKTLIEYNKIELDNVNNLLQKNPDVILCNPERIHMGKVLQNEYFSCNYEDYAEKYLQLDTKVYREDKNIEYYYDKYKKLNVFLKNKSS